MRMVKVDDKGVPLLVQWWKINHGPLLIELEFVGGRRYRIPIEEVLPCEFYDLFKQKVKLDEEILDAKIQDWAEKNWARLQRPRSKQDGGRNPERPDA